MRPNKTVLLLADRRMSPTVRALKSAGYRVLLSFTPDHAVAAVVNNDVDVVVLDQLHFVVTDNWSVAQSLKMVKANVCILLVVRGEIVRRTMPRGLDAIVPEGDSEALVNALRDLLENSGEQKSRRGAVAKQTAVR
jgi:DNA-binding response OmpR family regulator